MALVASEPAGNRLTVSRQAETPLSIDQSFVRYIAHSPALQKTWPLMRRSIPATQGG